MQQVLSKTNLQALQEHTYTVDTVKKAGTVSRFFTWCEKQEDNRFFWLGVSLFGSIGLVLPLTLMMVTFAFASNFAIWMVAAVVNVPVLAINLAAQPTKITLPFLFFAWLVNAGIILYSLAIILF